LGISVTLRDRSLAISTDDLLGSSLAQNFKTAIGLARPPHVAKRAYLAAQDAPGRPTLIAAFGGAADLTAPAIRMYGGVMIFTRTQLRAAFRRRSFDDDGSRRVRRQR